MRVFIYEHVSAGGLGPDAPESLRREGRAMLAAVAEDFARIAGVSVTTMNEPEHGDLTDTFRECVAASEATLVIAPDFGEILHDQSAWVVQAGRRLLGALPEAVRLCADKETLARHWLGRGVRTPATERAMPSPPMSFGPPWVCKPRHGAGSQATYLVPSAREWRALFGVAASAWPAGDLVVQPFLPGIAASVAFLLGDGGLLMLPPAAQLLSQDGRFQYRGGRVPLPAALSERATRVAREALQSVNGLQGYAGVDLVLGAAENGSEDYAIEINPRLTTSYIGLRRLCRDNLAKTWLNMLDGESVELAWADGVVEFSADGTLR